MISHKFNPTDKDKNSKDKSGISPFTSSARAIGLFIRNFHIIFPVYLVLFLIYFLVILAILSIVPVEKIEEIGYNISNEEQVVKELSTYLSKDLTKTIPVFLLFGLVIFILYEFNSAGLTSVAILISKTGKTTLKDFFEKGYIHTPKVVILDLFGGLLIFTMLSPLTTIFYQHVYFVQVIVYLIMIVFLIVLTYAKFFLIDRGKGIIESMAEAVRFMIKKPGSIMVYFIWFILIFPFSVLVLVSPFIIVVFPALVALMYVMMGDYYVSSESVNQE